MERPRRLLSAPPPAERRVLLRRGIAALFVNGFENEKIVISRSEFQLGKSDRRAH